MTRQTRIMQNIPKPKSYAFILCSLILWASNAQAEESGANTSDKNVLGRLRVEVGDFGSSYVGADDLEAKIRALEVDAIVLRVRQQMKLLEKRPLSR